MLDQGIDLDAVFDEYIFSRGAEGIRRMAAGINRLKTPRDHFSMVENIAALEETKSALTAMQATQAVAYEDSLSAERQSQKIRERNPGWGASKDVALAMRLSPKQGTRFTKDARVLRDDLPHTAEALKQGKLIWAQVQVVITGTRNLQTSNRRLIDRLLWEEGTRCFDQGTQLLAQAIEYWAKIFEPQTEADLEALAKKNRCVGVQQISPHEVLLKGRFPLPMGIALAQVLARETEYAQNRPGEERNAAQIRADSFYELVTGLNVAQQPPLEILLVMDAAVLSEDSNEPVLIPGYGLISAQRAREMIAADRAGGADELGIWVRGLFVENHSGRLVAMESYRRSFGGNLKKLIMVRDQYCRTPFCNAKIRDIDHVVQVRQDGETSAANGDGRCFSCNQTKEAPGWEEHPVKGERHSFQITTPSGHTYISTAPAQFGARPRQQLRRLIGEDPPG
ncbi:DUF222 domain-containing protein [Arthrobacter sp. MYb227]|uniref:DUF222 domain-containing protein n=1 Tax=Arthrobacter sp. MYb227 TaxID=1848601 RepID=UPI0015E44173|nr:DUF222 domain-containing protein [Arthrobacter sp. MYb227]